jgi:hypothetical protein
MAYERLVNEATQVAAQRLLDRLPPDQRQILKAPVHEEIRAAVLAYAEGLETLTRQLDPTGRRQRLPAGQSAGR